MNVFMVGHRTVMDGEVVIFATRFEKDGNDDLWFRPCAPFVVSASRNAVIIHQATCKTKDEMDALNVALKHAWSTREKLATTWSGGHDSMYPTTPTLVEESK